MNNYVNNNKTICTRRYVWYAGLYGMLMNWKYVLKESVCVYGKLIKTNKSHILNFEFYFALISIHLK